MVGVAESRVWKAMVFEAKDAARLQKKDQFEHKGKTVGRKSAHSRQDPQRYPSAHVRPERDLDPAVEHLADPGRPAAEVEVRARAVRDARFPRLDEVHLGRCQVHAVREDSVAPEQAEVVVHGGVGVDHGEEGCPFKRIQYVRDPQRKAVERAHTW